MKTNPLPSWGKHFFKDARVAVVEEVRVDREAQQLVWYARNIGLVRFMATVERVVLEPGQNSGETKVTKQCWIESR